MATKGLGGRVHVPNYWVLRVLVLVTTVFADTFTTIGYLDSSRCLIEDDTIESTKKPKP